MTDERRYQEEEVKEIFDLATSGTGVGPSALSEGSGLTLSDLQDVGREVGLEAERITEAALAVDARREILPTRKILGVPISAGRVVELPRALTDREWDVLVGDLRQTFGARGKTASHGAIREWTNGNLHAFLEPTVTGHRLRLGTRKGSATSVIAIGATGLIVGLASIALFLGEELGRASLVLPVVMAGTGVGTLIASALHLPRWARTREDQMEHIAGRVGALLGEGPQEEDTER